ncbi:hypothetical protein ACHRVZ_12785 [Flavobacterium sp. FlaQc-57]|uniref:hypothetical protein n=1 Tax=Flavobacterium sp. FlaQc-57 TaxID=3374186 RepID=UPI003757905E
MSIPVFILLSYYLSDLFLKITDKKKDNKRELSKNFQFIFFIGLIPSLFVFRYFENTIGGYNLFWKLAFFSLVFTVLTTIILNRYFDFSGDSKVENLLSICICFFLLIPDVGIFMNTQFSNEGERRQVTIINYKEINKRTKGGNSYNLFIKTPYDSNERLEVEKKLYESIKEDNRIVLTLRKGILGYGYVTRFDAQ